MTLSDTIQLQSTESKIIQCEFKTCKNELVNGGAVWIECKNKNHIFTFDFDTFEDNSAITAGCALYLNVASINIFHCRFLNNNNNENIVTDGADIYFIFEMQTNLLLLFKITNLLDH